MSATITASGFHNLCLPHVVFKAPQSLIGNHHTQSWRNLNRGNLPLIISVLTLVHLHFLFRRNAILRRTLIYPEGSSPEEGIGEPASASQPDANSPPNP